MTALSHLVCFSLTEDKYGIVQRDIPRILEAMISFLTALEQYQNELQTKYPTPTPEELAAMDPKERSEKAEAMVELERAFDVLDEVHGGEFTFVWRMGRIIEKLINGEFSVEGWVGENCADVCGEVGGVQVSTEDSEEVAGLCGLYLSLAASCIFYSYFPKQCWSK